MFKIRLQQAIYTDVLYQDIILILLHMICLMMVLKYYQMAKQPAQKFQEIKIVMFTIMYIMQIRLHQHLVHHLLW
ncbi:MAG TPA: hypothetical protein DCM21_03010 [Butyrivibrio sp.]|nr:hypothetical protein [Butyrivibrio sp.]